MPQAVICLYTVITNYWPIKFVILDILIACALLERIFRSLSYYDIFAKLWPSLASASHKTYIPILKC